MTNKQELTATFLGYQASGKTTFLVACLEANSSTGFNATAEPGPPNPGGGPVDNSEEFWEGQRERFRQGLPVEKTPTGKFTKFSFSILMDGRRFTLNTIDYPGELADKLGKQGSSRSGVAQEIGSLTQVCIESEILYLFLDADLLTDNPETQKLFHGQEDAITRGITIFSKMQPGRPMMLVVTKADLMFKGQKPAEIERRINELNENKGSGIDFLKSEFPKAGMDPAIFLQHRNVLRVCYVAALGVCPREIPPTRDQKVVGYARIPGRRWKPLGLRETIKLGFEAVAASRRAEQTQKWVRRLGPAALVAALLLVAILLYDGHAFRQVMAAKTAYAQETLNPGEVLTRARSADKFWHPTLNWPGRNTYFGRLPVFTRTEALRTTLRDFAILDFEARLDQARQKTEALPQATDIQVDSYEDLETKARDLLFVLNGLEAELEPLKIELVEPARQHIVETKLRPICYDIFYKFGLDAMQILWGSARHHSYEVVQVEPGIKELRERLYQIHLADTRPTSSPHYDQAIAVYDVGKCTLTAEGFLRGFNPTDADDKIIAVITKLQSGCPSEEVTKILQQVADQWDKNEALALYEAFPTEKGKAGVTEALYRLVTAYAENTAVRLQVGFQSRYAGQAEAFLSWHRALARGYTASEVTIEISQSNNFLSSHSEYYETGSGWSTETASRTVYDPPKGRFTMAVAGQEVAATGFDKISGTYALTERFTWEPNLPISFELYNSLSDQRVSLEVGGMYGLLKLQDRAVTYQGISVTLTGIEIPALRPKSLSYPR